MTRAEEYRRRAQECLELARSISLETARQTLIDMAQSWLRLAQEQEASEPLGEAEPRPQQQQQQPQQQQQQQQQDQPKDDDKKE
jgi:hypothetical protein